MSTTEAEVESFLRDFLLKLKIFEIVFVDREKNLQALFDLEMTQVKRKEIVENLKVQDYFKGPTKDTDGGPENWEFGKLCKNNEIYIKVTMGNENRPVICISFHIAERAITYPFKK